MKRHFVRIALVCCCLAAAFAAPSTADAARWSLGANYGFAVHHPDDGKTSTAFDWPGSAVAFQPGMRLGVTGGGRFSEGYLDLGLLFLDEDGAAHRDLQASLNFQRNLSPQSTTSLYFTAGGGIVHRFDEAGGLSISASSATFGGGVGVRNEVSNGFGSLRVEARVDRIVEGSNRGLVVIEPAMVYALKVGFDLWLFDEDD